MWMSHGPRAAKSGCQAQGMARRSSQCAALQPSGDQLASHLRPHAPGLSFPFSWALRRAVAVAMGQNGAAVHRGIHCSRPAAPAGRLQPSTQGQRFWDSIRLQSPDCDPCGLYHLQIGIVAQKDFGLILFANQKQCISWSQDLPGGSSSNWQFFPSQTKSGDQPQVPWVILEVLKGPSKAACDMEGMAESAKRCCHC